MLASQPAATLGLLLLSWLAGFEAGFGLLLWLPGGSFPAARREAGSSLFTLGFADRGAATPSVIDFFTAASGLVSPRTGTASPGAAGARPGPADRPVLGLGTLGRRCDRVALQLPGAAAFPVP